jgi:16S rRNA (adenine1518-N6/adenine1519-N6)-dimethyltransferase
VSPSSPRTVLRRLGLRAEKARGQHFLLHPHQARRIVTALELAPQDLVVEVGPGLGALTVFLARQAARVVALEVDPILAAYLREELFREESRVEVICQDVLRFDFRQRAGEAGAPLVVVGNLPYQITSPLLFKLAEEKAAVARALLMMQQEVGVRLTAGPGGKDYGILSVLLQYHFAITRLFSLGPANFFPPPQVTSVVVHLLPRRPDPAARDEAFFAQVVKAAFATRRKTLKNTLAARASTLGLSAPDVLAALQILNIDPGQRGETLSLRQFVDLSNELLARRKKGAG